MIEDIEPVTAADTAPTDKDEAALDAEKATADFLREHAESEKKEAQVGKATAEVKNYIFPPVTLLEAGHRIDPATEMEELQNNGRTLVETLKSFRRSNEDYGHLPRPVRNEI